MFNAPSFTHSSRLFLFHMVEQSCLLSSFRQLPVISICGATGTGKSELATNLASVFNGEVINFDALQLYNGLNIATNKIPPDKCLGVPHHLIGIYPPEYGDKYDVHSYRNICLPLIDNLRNTKKKLPILVGGTHYYLEAILWQDFLASKHTTSDTKDEFDSEVFLNDPMECYDLLHTLKPDTAKHLHPNNVRRVKRALFDALKESKTQTESGEIMNLDKQSLNRSIKPRYPGESLILWLDCASDVLNSHLDKRVDTMLSSGLIDELDTFLNQVNVLDSSLAPESNEMSDTHDNIKQTRSKKLKHLFSEESESVSDPMVRRGILQSIGLKEFSEYLALLPGERGTPEASILFKQAVENVKTATRKYARRQVSWIRNRFLRRPVDGSIPVFRIDVTDFLSSESSDTWNKAIFASAVRLVYNELIKLDDRLYEPLKQNTYLNSLLKICPDSCCPKPELLLLPKPFVKSNNAESPFICSICSGKIFTQLDSWEAHLKSRSHQKRTAKHNRRLLIEKAMKNLPS
ncbi:tRNA dimethylallyltransferase [Schistosoma japonicum]|uniref:tRNA dimethylallyltransferase n=2 Tax=Schistosoma japonicum TaxID=6182 RepID=A0A4Z2CYM8_SCHJA|nr:tRNA dimethylallyltransferase [Schistosoma japonicum]